MHSPAAERNRQPIAEVLQKLMPKTGHFLEIASGSGQHVFHLASIFRNWTFQPTDANSESVAYIATTLATSTYGNIKKPLILDVSAGWPTSQSYDVIMNANMIHISPWQTTNDLFQGAATRLSKGGFVFTYGPYFEDEVESAPSNLRFDASLKERNAQWGIRHLDEVAKVAGEHGFSLAERIPMPANNLSLVWRLST